MSWRRQIFEAGKRYRVVRDFSVGGWGFSAGEVLQFKSDAYSPYDGSFVYEFVDRKGDPRTWIMHEDTPVQDWQLYFEVVP